MRNYFPEYMDAFGKLEDVFTLEALKETLFQGDILTLRSEGPKDIWQRTKL